MTEKFKSGVKSVKARFCIRGDVEGTDAIRADSLMFRKGNIKTLLLIAAKEGWKVTTSDVPAAFLQYVPITRKLKRTVYGLVDASRGLHLSFSQKLAASSLP